MSTLKKLPLYALALGVLFALGCAKRIQFQPRPLAQSGKATGRIELTYNRNNRLEVKLSNVPDPSALDGKTCYVLWVATPDRAHIINVGQLRVDEKHQADIRTVTPLRKFSLLITAEPGGDVMSPGPDVVFESKPIEW
jgi:hypothetical protein